jgi:cell division septum initiation protein DivIVA
MDKDAIIKQLQDAIDQLKRENESLKACINELEAKLAMCENAHIPPSLKRNGNRKKDQNEGGRKKPGQKKGHKGVTRPPAKPDRHVDVTKDRCPDCGTQAW